MKSSKPNGMRTGASDRRTVTEPHAPLLTPRPHQERRHGKTRTDPYAWAADARDPELRDFLRDSNRHARQCLRPFSGLRRQIESELRALTPALEGGENV